MQSATVNWLLQPLNQNDRFGGSDGIEVLWPAHRAHTEYSKNLSEHALEPG